MRSIYQNELRFYTLAAKCSKTELSKQFHLQQHQKVVSGSQCGDAAVAAGWPRVPHGPLQNPSCRSEPAILMFSGMQGHVLGNAGTRSRTLLEKRAEPEDRHCLVETPCGAVVTQTVWSWQSRAQSCGPEASPAFRVIRFRRA